MFTTLVNLMMDAPPFNVKESGFRGMMRDVIEGHSPNAPSRSALCSVSRDKDGIRREVPPGVAKGTYRMSPRDAGG